MGIKLSDHFTYSKLIRYTFPTIVMTLFISLYGIMDGLFVSNFAGKTSFAAISLILPFVSAVSAFGYMIGTGGAALVAKTLGERQSERANGLFSMLILFTLVLGAIMSVMGLLLLKPVAGAMGAEGYDVALLNLSRRAFAFYSLSFLLCGFNIWGSGFFTALNNGGISAAISFGRTFLFQALAVMILPRMIGLDGIWLTMPAAEVMAFAVTVFFLKNRRIGSPSFRS